MKERFQIPLDHSDYKIISFDDGKKTSSNHRYSDDIFAHVKNKRTNPFTHFNAFYPNRTPGSIYNHHDFYKFNRHRVVIEPPDDDAVQDEFISPSLELVSYQLKKKIVQ